MCRVRILVCSSGILPVTRQSERNLCTCSTYGCALIESVHNYRTLVSLDTHLPEPGPCCLLSSSLLAPQLFIIIIIFFVDYLMGVFLATLIYDIGCFPFTALSMPRLLSSRKQNTSNEVTHLTPAALVHAAVGVT